MYVIAELDGVVGLVLKHDEVVIHEVDGLIVKFLENEGKHGCAPCG